MVSPQSMSRNCDEVSGMSSSCFDVERWPVLFLFTPLPHSGISFPFNLKLDLNRLFYDDFFLFFLPTGLMIEETGKA